MLFRNGQTVELSDKLTIKAQRNKGAADISSLTTLIVSSESIETPVCNYEFYELADDGLILIVMDVDGTRDYMVCWDFVGFTSNNRTGLAQSGELWMFDESGLDLDDLCSMDYAPSLATDDGVYEAGMGTVWSEDDPVSGVTRWSLQGEADCTEFIATEVGGNDVDGGLIKMYAGYCVPAHDLEVL